MTGLYTRVVLLNLAVTLALKGTDGFVADHDVPALLQQAIREERVPADHTDIVTKTITGILPPYNRGLTIQAYIGRLRHAARGLR